MWLPGDKKQIELRRDWAEVDGSGPWIIQYGATQVTVGGFRNRLAIFGGHPPRPKQKHIDKAVGKALRLDAEAQDTARDPSIEHANLVVEARKELEQ